MAVKTIQFEHHTLNISYEIVNPEAKYDIVFLHGWGSNKALMSKAFSPYLDTFRQIYIDLPGFGNSTCNLALTTDDYATIMERFFAQISASREIIVGHSFGGKVALLMNPSLLVLLSSAGIYTRKPLLVWLKIGVFKLFKYLGLAKLRSLFVASDAKELSEPMYQTFKNVVNEDFSKKFASFTGKALLCWGSDDTATPLFAGEKIESLIEDSKLVVFKGDHYFFMQHAQEVAAEIENSYIELLKH